ncbi:uncharacterized protein LOC105698696 [Orussus abietinus]|uniref:uncharacterized protein LOC105698696 n=1 Tax=Orussus abietinus TaxID=222816 RepID=UPI000626178A|nr:uncharacterized protein LOC105698696 [Orussus abietinus]
MAAARALLLAAATIATLALGLGLDLGPAVRVARCRARCLREHSLDGSCDRFPDGREIPCTQCWRSCEALEMHRERAESMCEGAELARCSACRTACLSRQNRTEEEYPPSALPAPRRGPVALKRNDVAVVLRKDGNEWRVAEYRPGSRVPALHQDTWIVAVGEEGGVWHFSWEVWVPTLVSLKEGPLFEATLSWRDVDDQLGRLRELERRTLDDRVRRFFLEKFGKKILGERGGRDESQIPDEVFGRFFFRKREEGRVEGTPRSREVAPARRKESFVVSWEPEAGGSMGNQVTDSSSAQISLLPGVKYLVRVASDEGPGSFPIEVDTRPDSVGPVRAEPTLGAARPWVFLAAGLGAAAGAAVAAVVAVAVLLGVRRKNKDVGDGPFPPLGVRREESEATR